MAELHIEKKERSNGLWIVLGLLVLALLAWWLFSQRDATEGVAGGEVVPAAATYEVPAAPAAQPVVGTDTMGVMGPGATDTMSTTGATSGSKGSLR